MSTDEEDLLHDAEWYRLGTGNQRASETKLGHAGGRDNKSRCLNLRTQVRQEEFLKAIQHHRLLATDEEGAG